MARNRSSASGGGSIPIAANARATSVAAPAPTMRPMRSSASGSAPQSRSSRFAASAMSLRESMSVPSRSNTMRRKAPVTTLERKAREDRREECSLRALRPLRSIVGPVFGEGCRCFPDGHANDRQSVLRRLVEDQPRNALDRRVAVDDVNRLAQRLQRRDERIVLAQDHLVVELAVDPPLDYALDIAEIADHVAVVERPGPHFDLGHRVVAVGMLADAVVVEQPVAVAEIYPFRDGVHFFFLAWGPHPRAATPRLRLGALVSSDFPLSQLL